MSVYIDHQACEAVNSFHMLVLHDHGHNVTYIYLYMYEYIYIKNICT